MAQSKTTRLGKSDVQVRPATAQDKVAQALAHASRQAKKQLAAQGLKLPTQNWTGSAVRNPLHKRPIMLIGTHLNFRSPRLLSLHWQMQRRTRRFSLSGVGTFVADWVDDDTGSKPVFNLAVALKDSWGE